METILWLVQGCVFPKELEVLQKIQQENHQESHDFSRARKAEIKKSSMLYRLDPVLDQNGLLHVGGRLCKSRVFPGGFKYPVILPKKSFVVDLGIRDTHERVGNSGQGITLDVLRSKYWIINTNSVVRHFILKCMTCRRPCGVISEQKMANLPYERLSPAPPFMYRGVDYFGPFCIKERRKELKHYGALFTCLWSSAHWDCELARNWFLSECFTTLCCKKRTSTWDQIWSG